MKQLPTKMYMTLVRVTPDKMRIVQEVHFIL